MATLLNLGDDCLILIVQRVTILDLFALRRACQCFCRVVNQYAFHLVRPVAHNTFPIRRQLIHAPSNGEYNLSWLKTLLLNQIATITVEQTRPFTRYWAIPAIFDNDDGGDSIWMHVTNGLKTLWNLSNIYREVFALPPEDHQITCLLEKAHSFIGSESLPCSSIIATTARELLVLEKRSQYMQGLPQEEIKYFRLAYWLLWTAFRSKLPTEPASLHSLYADLDWFRGLAPAQFKHASGWIDWLLLREGPMMFWRQWCRGQSTSGSNSIAHALLQTWWERDPIAARIEQKMGNLTLEAFGPLYAAIPSPPRRERCHSSKWSG